MSDTPPKTRAAAPRASTSPLVQALHKMGLSRDIDLALHVPLRYEDETRIVKLRDARDGDTVQIEATVLRCEVAQRPRRQLLALVDDGSARCQLRFFNFHPAQLKLLQQGQRVRARGELQGGFGGWLMTHPVLRSSDTPLPDALTPVYPSVAVLPQAYLRKAVLSGLARADLSELLPPGFLQEAGGGLLPSALPSLREALALLHQPGPQTSAAQLSALQERQHPAWQRLKAEELLAQQLSQLQARRQRARLRAPALDGAREGVQQQLLAALPFKLTQAQQRVSAEIAQDLQQGQPMHRLLQGDVGSGKTVVAALAAAQAIDSGWQCALMVPTELLAEQHFRKLVDWLSPLLAPRAQQVAWLAGGLRKRDKERMLSQAADGSAALVVGTHAVIQQQVRFAKLALVIVDEQHRFGVAQRLALREKMDAAQWEPHLLMMSATPIPRTLAMSYYADLSVSTLDELPPGRTPVLTKLVAQHRRAEVVARIRAQVAQGRQVYWVCPLIEESEALDLRNATATHAELSAALPGVQVGLLHSRMPVADKKTVMAAFAGTPEAPATMAVLVSTTVIEVGIDVPNASLMVIEHAERFGLSQLHQLRGRVGRGAAASACVLLYGSADAPGLGEGARERLKAMVECHDGFEIARRDLSIRGPGEFLGARQSGAPLLRFADVQTDAALLRWAHQAAPRLLDQHPALAARLITRWLGGRAEYLMA